MRTPAALDLPALTTVLQALADRHDLLRATLVRPSREDTGEWSLLVPPVGTVDAAGWIERVDVSGLDAGALGEAVREHTTAARASLDPDAGVMVRAVWFDAGDAPGRLLLMVHHLVVDGVSWRVLLPDLEAAWQDVRAGRPIGLVPVETSFARWSRLLTELAQASEREAELPVWDGDSRRRHGVPAARPANGTRTATPPRPGARWCCGCPPSTPDRCCRPCPPRSAPP